MEAEPLSPSLLTGGWELQESDGQKTNAHMLYLNAVGASDNMVRTALLRPLVGLIIDRNNSALCIRRIGGTVPGFPPERLRLDGSFGVAYNETGRQWVRLLNHNPANGELQLERVGPRSTFPMIREKYVVERPANGPEVLVKTTKVVSFLGLEIYRGKQRFTRMTQTQLYNQRQTLEAPMAPEEVEGIYRELGRDVLILAVENADSSSDLCKMLSACGATHQEYLIGVAGMQERSPYLVRRRYREFRALYELTKDLEGDAFPDFPPKTFLVPAYGEVLLDRRRKLQQFLSHLIELPTPRESGLWHAQRDFLLVGQNVEPEPAGPEASDSFLLKSSSSSFERPSASDSADPLTRNLNHMRAQSVRRRHRDDPRRTIEPIASSKSMSSDSGLLSPGLESISSMDSATSGSRGPDLGNPKAKTSFALSAHLEEENEEDDEEDDEGLRAEDKPTASAVPPALVRTEKTRRWDNPPPAGPVGTASPLSSGGEQTSAATSAAGDLGYLTASYGEDSDENAVKSMTDWLSAGILVTKFSSKEKAYPRVLYYNAPRDVLFWTKCGEKSRIQKGKTISIRDIRTVELCAGRANDAAVGPAAREAVAAQCVKITTTRREYDFELDSAGDAEKLARGLLVLRNDC